MGLGKADQEMETRVDLDRQAGRIRFFDAFDCIVLLSSAHGEARTQQRSAIKKSRSLMVMKR